MNCGRTVDAQQVVCMNDTSDTKRLAEAVAHIATTITEIIELKIGHWRRSQRLESQLMQ